MDVLKGDEYDENKVLAAIATISDDQLDYLLRQKLESLYLQPWVTKEGLAKARQLVTQVARQRPGLEGVTFVAPAG